MSTAKITRRSWLLAALIGVLAPAANAEVTQVAVASNFVTTAARIASAFEAAQPNHQVVLITASTGKHYAQIRNGAHFDLFFAADAERPALLEKEGRTVPGSRFTYAVGRLALWSPTEGLVDPKGEVLRKGNFRRLAIASPKTAPYGAATQQVLEALGLWQGLEARVIRGEDVGQAYQFIVSRGAELGFVALAQLREPGNPPRGSHWEVPANLHQPIEQQAVFLKRAADNPAAVAFFEFARSQAARDIVKGFGYDLAP